MDERKSFLVKHFGLRGVAILEASKGALALGLAIALITLVHKDVQAVAERLLEFLHVSPDRRLSQAVLHAAGRVSDRNLWIFVLLVLVYTTVRFVEATGLWLEKEWAEWFALLSGSLYLPWEIYELMRRPSPVKWVIFSINVLIVLYLAWLLMASSRARRVNGASHTVSNTPGQES